MQSQQKRSTTKSQDSFINGLLFKYLPYWPLFLVSIILFVACAYVYLLYVTPKYEATASLIIQDEKKGNEVSKSVESLDFFTTKKIVENETEVLMSWALMTQVVKALSLYAPIYEEGEFRDNSAYVTSPVSIEAKYPDSINFVERVDLSFNRKSSVVTLNQHYHYPLNKWVETPFGIFRFSRNSKDTSKPDLGPLYFSLIPPATQAKGMVANLMASSVTKESAVIKLSYRDEVPERAEDILNMLMDAYNNVVINDKKKLASNTISFVDDRMDVVAKELDSIERQIQQFKAGNEAIDLTRQGELVLQNVSTNEQKLSEINSTLNVLNQVERYVLSKEKGGSVMLSTLAISDPVLSNMLNKLNEFELEFERLKSSVGEGHPLLTSISDQIDKLRPNILANIQSQRNNLLASREAITSTNGVYGNILQGLPQKEKDLLEISRDQSIKSSIYSFLLQKREESAISIASTVSDMRVVDRALASEFPVSPNKMIIYGTAAFLGVLLVIGFINIKEALSQKLLYRQDIESFTSIPIIGEIAYNKAKQLLVVEDGKRSLLAEEFRKIRVSLPYIGIGADNKKMLVTSSISGEGKSFVAVNLAQTLALTGKKVALVDMDLHNPSLGQALSSVSDENQKGVSEYLTGQCGLADIVNKTSFNNNLYLVPAGSIPPNPSELLCNERVRDLIDYLANTFDYVIIDAAPVIPISDAYELSSYCDATLFVVRHRYTPKMLVQRIDESAKVNPLKNPAIIFNGIKNRGLTHNNYGYGYGYIRFKELEAQDKKSKAIT